MVTKGMIDELDRLHNEMNKIDPNDPDVPLMVKKIAEMKIKFP